MFLIGGISLRVHHIFLLSYPIFLNKKKKGESVCSTVWMPAESLPLPRFGLYLWIMKLTGLWTMQIFEGQTRYPLL